MSPTPANPAAEEPLLRPKNCPRCDYSLLGLPAIGVCPECGRAYDTVSVFLYGHALGQRANAWNRAPMRRSEIITSVVVILSAFALFSFGRMHDSFFQLYLVVFIAVPMVATILRGRTTTGSGVVQVKLTPTGFHQGTRQLGPIPYDRCDRAHLTPWSRNPFVTLIPKGPERVEIRFSPRDIRWKYRMKRVHAEVACTAEELKEIRARIAMWRDGGSPDSRRSPNEERQLSRG
jgi:hypothetical protein